MTTLATEYKGAYLVVHSTGVDIIDPETNSWKVSKSMRAAKWNLSVWRRLTREFRISKKLNSGSNLM